MKLDWIHEAAPVWDEEKQRVIGGAPQGALDVRHEPGSQLSGDWWSATDESGVVVGYGWLDATWGGDAEVLLAVDPDRQGEGVGAFVLNRLEQEAATRGINYVYNTVRETHPDRDRVQDWLAVRGFRGSVSDPTMRKRVVADSGEPVTASKETLFDPGASASTLPPGHEESGGYVDIDEHRY
jgi:GNAT superfamily N-acetyltransferase